MKETNVKLLNKEEELEKEIKAFCFVVNALPSNVKYNDNEKDKEKEMEIEEYTLDKQNNLFNPMQHVINQQERYLNMSLDFDIKDSW